MGEHRSAVRARSGLADSHGALVNDCPSAVPSSSPLRAQPTLPARGRHAPPPRHPSRLWLGLMAAAVTGIVGGTVAAAHVVAPRVAADVRLSLTPENSPEPVGHGGPLSVPSIGAVTSDPVAYLPPAPRPPQRPQEPRRTAWGSTDSQPTVSGAPSATPEPAITTPAPTVTETTQAATIPAPTTATTEAATTTTEATTTSATTTSETATVTETTTIPTEEVP